GVEHLVAFIPVTAAVILARTGFSDDVDAGPGGTGVFGRVAVEQHFDFADGGKVDRARKDVRAAQIVTPHAVHVECVLGVAPALNLRDAAAEAAARRLALPAVVHAGQDF